MKLKVIIRLAFVNLWSHRTRTFLTVAGVTIGITAIIFLVSLGYGLEELVTEQVANFNAFTIIDVPSSDSAKLKINQDFIDRVTSINHVNSYAPVCNIAGRINKLEDESTAETVIVSANNEYFEMSETRASTGALPQSADEIAVNQSVISVIGEDADTVIGRDVEIEVIIPESMISTEDGEASVSNKNIRMKVVGIVDYSDSPVIFTNIDLLKNRGVTSYSLLKVKLDDSAYVAEVRSSIENTGFSTEYVGDTLEEINRVFSLFRIVLAALGVIALIVAALGTFNTLTISLLERTKEVGLFKAIGMRNRDVYRLFISEAILIGLMGGLLGLILGIGLGQACNALVQYFANQANVQALRLFVTPYLFAFAVSLFSLIVGFLTGWYPSSRAVKIDPLDAMRYE